LVLLGWPEVRLAKWNQIHTKTRFAKQQGSQCLLLFG
jgi:hypothetical protein